MTWLETVDVTNGERFRRLRRAVIMSFLLRSDDTRIADLLTQMPVINQSQLVPYTADEMFALVADVEAYPAFLPWCERSWVVSRDGAVTRAGMAVRKGRVHYSFLTDSIATPPQRLEVHLAEGPFRKLEGDWTFAPNALGCRVSFVLDFEFESRLVGAALAPVFKLMTSTLVSSFRERAVTIYGRR